MAALDMDRLPSGVQGWGALIQELLAAGDDRHEGHHLELKSEIDMSTKAGRAKIAKFILATANRSPEIAARRFGGSAVMLVGLDYSSTPPAVAGAGAFDDKDLRREVTNFVGDPGPGWDYQRIDVGGAEVVAITAAPPDRAAIWPCQRDGEGGMRTGVLYLRAGAETRPATGPEVTAMIDRVRDAQPDVDIDVQIVGEVRAVAFDPTKATALIGNDADSLRATCPAPSSPTSFEAMRIAAAATIGRDARTRRGFHDEVDRYASDAAAALEEVREAMTAILPGFCVRVVNNTKLDLHDVEVVIHLDAPYDVVNHSDEVDKDLLPDRPREWGPEPLVLPGRRPTIDPTSYLPPAGFNGWIDVTERDNGEIDLVVDIGHLRPRGTVTTADDELVLTVPVEHTATLMDARWSMTATGIHEQFTGDIEPVATVRHDASEAVARYVATAIRRR